MNGEHPQGDTTTNQQRCEAETMVEFSEACGTMLAFMVVVAQLVEHQFVVLRVAGSSPVDHPKASR